MLTADAEHTEQRQIPLYLEAFVVPLNSDKTPRSEVILALDATTAAGKMWN